MRRICHYNPIPVMYSKQEERLRICRVARALVEMPEYIKGGKRNAESKGVQLQKGEQDRSGQRPSP